MAIIDATIVSVFQKDIPYKIPGVYPGDYLIPAAETNDISVMRVPVSRFYVDAGEGLPSHAVLQDPSDVAKAIVYDICKAFIEVGPDAKPGLFAIDGWINKEEKDITIKDIEAYKAEIKTKYAPQLQVVRSNQERWCRKLVERADDDWNKHHSFRAITDTQRWAAKYLGLNRPYLEVDKTMESVECPACGMQVRKGVAVCFHCKAILDMEKAKKFGLA